MHTILRTLGIMMLLTLLAALLVVSYVAFVPRIEIGGRPFALMQILWPSTLQQLDNPRLMIEADSWRRKRLTFSATLARLHLAAIDLAARDITLSLTLELKRDGLKVTRCGPAGIGELRLHLHSAKADEPTAGQDSLIGILTTLAAQQYDEIVIRSLRLTLTDDTTTPLFIRGSCKLTGFNLHPVETLRFRLAGTHGRTGAQTQGTITFGQSDGRLENVHVSGLLSFAFNQKGRRATATVTIAKKPQVPWRIAMQGASPGWRLTGKATGDWQAAGMAGELSAFLSGTNEVPLRVGLAPCHWSVDLRQGGAPREVPRGKLSCQGAVDGGRDGPTGAALTKLFGRHLPFSFVAEANDATQRRAKNGNAALVVTARLMTRPLPLPLPPLQHFVQVDLRGVITPDSFRMSDASSAFTLRLFTDHFEQVVRDLAATPWAIPAPFNELSGGLGCTLHGNALTLHSAQWKLPLECFVRLKSPEQTQFFTGTGTLAITLPTDAAPDFFTALDFLIDIEQIDLVLPKIAPLEPPPQFFPDPRFAVAQQPSAQGLTRFFSYHVAIRTRVPGALRIHSNLFQKPLPLSVDAAVQTSGGMSGQLVTRDWPLTLLRRKVQVEHLTLGLAPGDAGAFTLDGLFKVPSNQYTITIGLLGTVEHPRIFLQSDPPLDERNILAVLLFGKEPNFLDADKLQSVENASAALADGMVNLVSMYYLASTPIESVGYNPATKVFSATFDLKQGLAMTVGAGAENQREIGLRKNLGHGFSLETTGMENNDDGSGRGVAMFRWRYAY